MKDLRDSVPGKLVQGLKVRKIREREVVSIVYGNKEDKEGMVGDVSTGRTPRAFRAPVGSLTIRREGMEGCQQRKTCQTRDEKIPSGV